MIQFFLLHMLEPVRKKRQAKVIILCGLILAIIVVLWNVFVSPSPTCSDGKRNQDETGVDCGGVCGVCKEAPHILGISVLEASVVKSGSKYDVMARLKNPNDAYGAADISYEFRLKDISGDQIFVVEGHDYILPKQEKYVVAVGLDVPTVPTSAELVITRVQWAHFTAFDEPKFTVRNKQFSPISSGPGFALVSAIIRNDTPNDFGSVSVAVILRDINGVVVAIGRTQMNTIKSGEERDFHLPWPDNFIGEVARIDVFPETNVFKDENLIRRYFPGGKFQEL